MTDLLGGDAGQSGLHLQVDDLLGHAQLPLFLGLAHADDGVQPRVDGGVSLAVDDDVVVIPILTAFGVADDGILHVQLLEHGSGDLAGECAVILKVDVLRADHHTGVLECLLSCRDVHKGDAQENVAPLCQMCIRDRV